MLGAFDLLTEHLLGAPLSPLARIGAHRIWGVERNQSWLQTRARLPLRCKNSQ
jgi:hypothetical protein